MKTNFDIFNEISFDYTDDNNVTHVDGFTTTDNADGNGMTLGYIINGEFYPTDSDILAEPHLMNIINSYITDNLIKKF